MDRHAASRLTMTGWGRECGDEILAERRQEPSSRSFTATDWHIWKSSKYYLKLRTIPVCYAAPMVSTGQTSTPQMVSAKLASSGLRSTPQREVVFAELLRNRDHPTAEEVHARVRNDLPSISLATVYNCLETLVQCSLVRAVNFERGPTRYCPNLEPHGHFYDESTGKTLDVDLPPALLEQVKQTLPAGYDASSIEIIFRGKVSAEHRA